MADVRTAIINRGTIENAYTYEEYRELIDNLLANNKTTGENHSESMLHYTKMNVHRMKRLDKRGKLKGELVEKLDSLDRPLTWLILTEGWCGDAAQLIPMIQKMADQTKLIQTRYILRDENLEIMDQFLTDGRARSIPKLICLDSQTLEVVDEWGPRPNVARKIYTDLRNNDDLSPQERAEKLHKWYADDKTESLQNEFVALIEEWGE